MDGLEDKLNAILSDPDAMGRIADMAKSIMGGEGEGSGDTGRGEADESMIRRAMKLMRGKALSTDEASLLSALRPVLSAEWQQRLDRAIKLARLASLASLAGELGVLGGDDGV